MAPMPEEKPQEDEGQNPNGLYPNQPTFDAEKLHQAILAFRPVSGQFKNYSKDLSFFIFFSRMFHLHPIDRMVV